jgi:hypothetical protein
MICINLVLLIVSSSSWINIEGHQGPPEEAANPSELRHGGPSVHKSIFSLCVEHCTKNCEYTEQKSPERLIHETAVTPLIFINGLRIFMASDISIYF